MPLAYYLQAELLSEVVWTDRAPNNTHSETADKVDIPETNVYRNNLALWESQGNMNKVLHTPWADFNRAKSLWDHHSKIVGMKYLHAVYMLNKDIVTV
jgi:hypothetical protein